MSTFTKKQLIERAREKVKSLELAITQTAFADLREELEEELELARIALASLEAEAVAYIRSAHKPDGFCFADGIHPTHRHQRLSLSTLQDGCYWEVAPLFSAPPAPVAMKDHQIRDLVNELRDIAVEYCGTQQLRERIAKTVRAAMLQGAEHVTTAYKLRNAVETIRSSGIAIDADKIFAERDALNAPDCWCRTCRPITHTDMRFVVCPDCGNKRCPHANDHRNACTGSNEPGQESSAYPAAPQQEVK